MTAQPRSREQFWWFYNASLLVHPWVGRLIGFILVLLPGVLFGFLLWLKGDHLTLLGVIGWIVLSVPGILTAALLHEGGHMLALRRMGAGARLVWHLPLDIRTLPRSEDLEFHTCDRLIQRGGAGFLANLLCWGILLAGAVATGVPLPAHLALWHGISALAATAWVTKHSATDAATLCQALSFTDRPRLQVGPEAQGKVKIKAQVELSVRANLIPVRDYWIKIQGLTDLQLSPQSAQPRVFSISEDETLLLWCAVEPGDIFVAGSGRPSADRIVCISKGGTVVSAVPG